MSEKLKHQLQALQAENEQLRQELAARSTVASRSLASFQQRALHMEITCQKNEELDRLTQDLSKMNTALEQEVAERRQVEKELREQKQFIERILDTAPVFICVTTRDGKVRLINQAAANLFGKSKEEVLELLHQAIRQNNAELSATLQADQQVINTGETIYLEETFTTPNGGTRWYDTVKMPLEREDGSVDILSISSDITHRKLSEEALRTFAAKLESSNQELEQFAYISSHDLQEPLRKIQAFGGRLQAKYADALDERGLDYLERMRSAADRMQCLINGLLDYSRVTTNARPFSVVNLNEIVRDVVSNLDTHLKQANGKVELKELPQIEADPVQMRQLMQNLISNSLKFHQQGRPPLITIEANYVTRGETRPLNELDPGQYCRISITDNGIGFDEKYRDRIFQVFQRLHTRSQYEGTGIGLATCLKIVNRHGGEITVSSRPGVGTTFNVTLPMQQPKGETKYEY